MSTTVNTVPTIKRESSAVLPIELAIISSVAAASSETVVSASAPGGVTLSGGEAAREKSDPPIHEKSTEALCWAWLQ